ncbi:HAD family hydrolase [Mucilaginibacter myungsuensis]|uniref:HAD family phosphatase n=1 Tax=Mucilaginibacter myungsuensis TaxID=649104 RepID=A0A929KWH8_9SPHI|nr:HAD family phosphatase [Mucilaginibacter myungsuensis]MBE9662921.1 HAD family phosphatase [Mucilaginibacter myungsuensis]MDN3598543.1 HAD family phosphatase [Mucilaginibacter myungsuensis]
MQNIKNIIFDYGNVIFSIDFKLAQQAFTDLGIGNADQFFGHRQQDAIFDAFDKGEITAAQFRDRIREIAANPAITDEQIDAAWNSMLLGIAEGNHDLLLKVKDKYRTFLMSNINDIHYSHIMNYLRRDFQFEGNDHLFERTYYSHLVGKRKPDTAFFQQLLDENGLVAAETLFIDDSPQHLVGAEALGIQTFLMTAPDTLQKFFERNGLL